jgi:hypothetical protein
MGDSAYTEIAIWPWRSRRHLIAPLRQAIEAHIDLDELYSPAPGEPDSYEEWRIIDKGTRVLVIVDPEATHGVDHYAALVAAAHKQGLNVHGYNQANDELLEERQWAPASGERIARCMIDGELILTARELSRAASPDTTAGALGDLSDAAVGKAAKQILLAFPDLPTFAAEAIREIRDQLSARYHQL